MIYNEEHIFQLILEKLSGEISDEDWRFLQTAMEQDASIRRCMEEMEEALKAAGPEFMNDVYNEMAWGSVLAVLQGEKTPKETPATVVIPIPAVTSRRLPARTWWLAAATVLVIITGAYFMLSGNKAPAERGFMAANTISHAGNIRLQLANGDSLWLPEAEGHDIPIKTAHLKTTPGQLTFTASENSDGRLNQLTVPTGKDYEVILSDGSSVHLNAFSSIRFPFAFTGNTREVYLEGEAYFKIAPNAHQPFIVHTSRTAVKVLGTAFNINAYADNMVVTSLVQGSIMTGAGDHPDMLLQPGQETIFRNGQQTRQAFDSTATLGWMKGEYPYYNTSLGTLSTVIYHWYGKTMQFDDPSLAERKLTGVIERDRPLAEFLESLVKTSGITYRITDDKIWLTSK